VSYVDVAHLGLGRNMLTVDNCDAQFDAPLSAIQTCDDFGKLLLHDRWSYWLVAAHRDSVAAIPFVIYVYVCIASFRQRIREQPMRECPANFAYVIIIIMVSAWHVVHSSAAPDTAKRKGARTCRTLLEGTAKRPCRKYAKPRPMGRVLGRLLHLKIRGFSRRP